MPAPIVNPDWKTLRKICRDPEATLGFAGPPGTGKTSLCFSMGKRMKKPVTLKVQLHEELSPVEIMGAEYPSSKGHVWVPAAGSICYDKGGLLILDELDLASGPTKTLCYALLDRGPGGTFTHIGRTFEQAPGYQAWATMNGDPTDGSLPQPLLDRFDAWFLITEPCPEQYALLDDDLSALCRTAYTAARDPMQGPDYTFRMFRALQKWRTKLPLDQACLAACHGKNELAYSFYEILTLKGD